VGDTVKGKVLLIADYGAFVEILPGVEGLIHVSEMSWSQHLRSPHDFLKVGDEVDAVILTLDREERKMSLGMKQSKADPWIDVAAKYPVGSKHTTIVRNFQPFGVFVELEEGVDGLVHISDLSWTKKLKHPNEFCKVGDKLDVVVLEVDAENHRLSLGHQLLEDNPWDVFESMFAEGSIHEGTVLKNADKGAIIALPYGIEGYAPGKHLVKEDGKSLRPDDKAEFKIIEFNKEAKRIVVSHSRIHEDKAHDSKSAETVTKEREKEDTSKTVKRMKDSSEKTTLGDISALSNLKTEMEATEKKKAKKKAAAEAKSEEVAGEVVENNVQASAEKVEENVVENSAEPVAENKEENKEE
jgi:small subunit ribosomal protein S1